MADVPEGHAVGPVQFLRNLYLARELCAGIQLFATPATVVALEEALAQGGFALTLPTGAMASNDHFTAATLVFPCAKRAPSSSDSLPDVSDALEAPDFAPGRDPTPDGVRAAALLKEWAYGVEGTGCPLVHAMVKGSLQQAETCVAACVAALLDCVAPATCLSLLALAERCGCGPLYCVALRCALDNFAEAVREDTSGLRLLSSTQMARLLRADALAVASEYEAFAGLVAWVEADPTDRLATPVPKQPSAFAALLRDCVRLSAMTYEELELVDEAPVMAKDKKAIACVAMAIIQATNGWEEGAADPRRPRGAAPSREPLLPAVLETGALQLGRAPVAVDEAVDMLVSPARRVQGAVGSGTLLPTQRALFSDRLIDN